MDTVKVIGRISAKGTNYFQTAVKVEGEEKDVFIPVYLKKGLDKMNYISIEKKIDKNGKIYDLYTFDAKHVFFPEPEEVKHEDGTVELKRKAIITK